jgi:hypothetical protein
MFQFPARLTRENYGDFAMGYVQVKRVGNKITSRGWVPGPTLNSSSYIQGTEHTINLHHWV